MWQEFHNAMSRCDVAMLAVMMRIFLMCAVWATIPCEGLYNMSSLGMEYITMASKDTCHQRGGSVLGVPGLAEVVERAARRGGEGGGHVGTIPKATVALTTCDVKVCMVLPILMAGACHCLMSIGGFGAQCLHMLFEPFMKSIEKARGGDFSPHLVIM